MQTVTAWTGTRCRALILSLLSDIKEPVCWVWVHTQVILSGNNGPKCLCPVGRPSGLPTRTRDLKGGGEVFLQPLLTNQPSPQITTP